MTKPKPKRGDTRHYTDIELGEIARQALGGHLWTSDIVAERYRGDLDRIKQAMEMTFPILMLMDNKQRKDLAKDPPVMVWEEMSQAAPSMINGMPIFFSVRMMFKADYEAYRPIYEKMHYALQAATPRVKKPYKEPSV